jgi:hypothetical protein
MLATTTPMLPTTQYMNNWYSMEYLLDKLCETPLRSCLPLLFDPPLSAFKYTTPSRIRRALRKCARDPTEALHRHIYHRPDRPNYSQVAPKNRVSFNSSIDAEEAGYRVAGNCP